MQYFTVIGDFLQAYNYCLEHGGQLYTGNGKDSANVVVIGKKCYTFWEKNSKRYEEVKKLALFFGLPPEGQTGGRIARWLIDEMLKVPYQNTYFSPTYRTLAKQGNHWHYMHCDSRVPFFGIEVDLKSAYFSSLFTFPTLLYHPIAGYLPDNNALENLKHLYPDLPKWFRLQFLGCLSSWRIFFLCRDKKNLDSKELVKKSRHYIKYGGAFNVAHRAVLRNYKIMQKIHKIGGKYIRRMHTDSFFLDWDIPNEVELALWDYLEEKKLKYSIKGFGRCFFWDINTGIIGNKFVGAPIEVKSLMRESNVKMLRPEKNQEVFEKFNYFSSNHLATSFSDGNSTNIAAKSIEQLSLFSDKVVPDDCNQFS